MRKRNSQPTVQPPCDLDLVEKQLTEWRRTHKPPCPLPEEVWIRAAELAARLGVNRVARTLRLEPAALKRRVNSPTPTSPPAATFIELLSPVTNNIGECALEVESARGARLRVLMKNVAPTGLATIIRDFVGGAV